MSSKIRSFITLSLLMLMLSACVGPPKDQKCIPDDGSVTGTPTASPGTGTGTTAAEIDAYIRNGKIITNIVMEIKSKVLGTNNTLGAGIPTVSIGGQTVNFGNYSASQGIFEAFVSNPDFQMAVAGTLALFVLFYGVGITTGIVQMSLNDAVIRVAKIGFISVIALNWGSFYQVVGTFFVDGTDELIAFFMNTFGSLYNAGASVTLGVGDLTAQIFSRYDEFLANIFSYQTFAFVSALLNMKASGPYAPVYALFLMLGLWWVLQGIIKVVSVYVFSLFGKALLFAIAPVFMLFILFQQTKPMFDAWIKQMVSLSLQPILITAYIGLFSNLISPFFEEFAQYKLCWNKLDNTTNKYGWTFVDPDSSTNDPVDFGASSPPPISLQAVLLFGFFSWLFISALRMTDNIVISISGSIGTNISALATYNNLKNLGQSGAADGKVTDAMLRQGKQL